MTDQPAFPIRVGLSDGSEYGVADGPVALAEMVAALTAEGHDEITLVEVDDETPDDEAYANAGALTGRPPMRATGPSPDVDDDGEIAHTGIPEAKAIPANCLRVLNTPLDRNVHGCHRECPGIQQDGSCLADIVRKANEQGVDWRFDLERDRGNPDHFWWVYVGDPVDLTEPEVEEPEAATWVCPHCSGANTHDPANFHWWCVLCGKNAQDAVEAPPRAARRAAAKKPASTGKRKPAARSKR